MSNVMISIKFKFPVRHDTHASGITGPRTFLHVANLREAV